MSFKKRKIPYEIRHTQGEGHVKKEADIGVMLSQAKEYKDSGNWKREVSSSPSVFRRSITLTIPCFQISNLQNCERINFGCFKTTNFVVLCYVSPRKLKWTLHYELLYGDNLPLVPTWQPLNWYPPVFCLITYVI